MFVYVVLFIDEGKIRIIVGKYLGKINVVNLIDVYKILEEGWVIGKLVLEGF